MSWTRTFFLSTLFLILHLSSPAQMNKEQFFDGADTSYSNSLIIDRDTAEPHVWDIGHPQKSIFDSAASQPNVIVTDTVDPYPTDVHESFQFGIGPDLLNYYGILAVQWVQRLDLEKDRDGGLLEYSLDTGATWHSVFNDSLVYNFYGFQSENKDTLYTGEYAFSGTDSTWRDIWLCFHHDSLDTDSLLLRYTLHSDTSTNSREGWMIDNFVASYTAFHTIKEQKEVPTRVTIRPNPTKGRVYIRTERKSGAHGLKRARVLDLNGRVLKRYPDLSGQKEVLELGDRSAGPYFLQVITRAGKKKTVRVMLEGR